MHYLLSTLLGAIFFSNNAISADLSEAHHYYLESLTGSPEGVVETARFTYFIEDVTCLKNKNYVGSKESKHARRLIDTSLVQLLTQTVNKVDFSLQYPPSIASMLDIQYRKNQAKVDISRIIKRQLVIDKNIDKCTRRVVIAILTQDIKTQQSQQKNVDEKLLFSQLLENSFQSEKYEQLATIYKDLNNPILSLIFAAQNSNKILTIDNGINWLSIEKSVELKNEFCKERKNVLLKNNTAPISITYNNLCENLNEAVFYGIAPNIVTNSFVSPTISIINKSLGIINFTPKKQNINSSLLLSEQADVLFNKGSNPSAIISLLSVSLHLNPHQAKQWNQIGTVFKSLGQNKLALSSHIQAAIQQPDNLDSWLHLIKTLRALKLNQQALTFEKHLVQAALLLPHSRWVKQHLKNSLIAP